MSNQPDTSIEVILGSGDTLVFPLLGTIQELKNEIEKKIGVAAIRQQLFSSESETPLGDVVLTDRSYYLIIKNVEPIVDKTMLQQLLKLWKEGEHDDIEYIMKSYGRIEDWDVSMVTDMGYLFKEFLSPHFNYDLSRWDVSNVKYMSGMFSGCKKFNGDLSRWDVSSVKDMRCMFDGCKKFNSDLSGWDVSSVTNMTGMFKECNKFNSDLSGWDVSSVLYMDLMFYECKKFNSDLSGWDVSRVKDMRRMFDGCKKFNSDLSGWDVSRVKDKSCMFTGGNKFNMDLIPSNIPISYDNINSISLYHKNVISIE
jgi:surface protein